MLLLAQSSPSLSPEFFGMVVLALMLLTRWLWEYNREQRAKEALHEPKATPPLHTQFAAKADLTKLEVRVDNLTTEIRGGFDRLDAKRSSSIAGIHDDLNAGLEKVHKRIDAIPAHVISLLRETQQLHGKK